MSRTFHLGWYPQDGTGLPEFWSDADIPSPTAAGSTAAGGLSATIGIVHDELQLGDVVVYTVRFTPADSSPVLVQTYSRTFRQEEFEGNAYSIWPYLDSLTLHDNYVALSGVYEVTATVNGTPAIGVGYLTVSAEGYGGYAAISWYMDGAEEEPSIPEPEDPEDPPPVVQDFWIGWGATGGNGQPGYDGFAPENEGSHSSWFNDVPRFDFVVSQTGACIVTIAFTPADDSEPQVQTFEDTPDALPDWLLRDGIGGWYGMGSYLSGVYEITVSVSGKSARNKLLFTITRSGEYYGVVSWYSEPLDDEGPLEPEEPPESPQDAQAGVVLGRLKTAADLGQPRVVGCAQLGLQVGEAVLGTHKVWSVCAVDGLQTEVQAGDVSVCAARSVQGLAVPASLGSVQLLHILPVAALLAPQPSAALRVPAVPVQLQLDAGAAELGQPSVVGVVALPPMLAPVVLGHVLMTQEAPQCHH